MASLMMVMWQSGSDNELHMLTICIFLITGAMVLQAIVLIAAGLSARKTQQKLVEVAEDLRRTVTPFLQEARAVVHKTSDLIDDVGPAVRTISRNAEVASANVAVATERFKNKAQEFDELTTEIRQRTQMQVRRVDGLVSDGLGVIGDIGAAIHRAVLAPVREIHAVMNGVKAGLDTLLGKARKFGVYTGGRESHREEETRL